MKPVTEAPRQERPAGPAEDRPTGSRRGWAALWARRSGPWGWVLPAVALILFVNVFPLLYAAWLSLYDKDSLAPVGTFTGLSNYTALLSDPDFWHALRTGLGYAFGSVVLQMLLGLGAALLLHRAFRGRGAARAISLMPYMIPTAAVAMMFGLMFDNLYGIVNQLLTAMNIIEEPILFFGDKTWALPAVIFTAAWKWTPFAIIVFLARLQTIDDSLYECARVEGAGPIRSFFDITLPSLRSAIFLIVLLRSIWMFNKFDIPYLLTQGGPAHATETLPIFAYDVNFLQFMQGRGAALAVIMSCALLIFAVPYFVIFKPEKEVRVD